MARLSSGAKAAASISLESELIIGVRPTSFVFQLGSQAAHWACRGGSLDVIKALRRHGADLNGRDKVSHICGGSGGGARRARQCDGDLTPSMLQLCSTPLHVATRTGQVDIVEHLLSCDVKINYKDRVGSAPLWFAQLFDLVCSIKSLFDVQEGDTALHDAVRLNRYKIVKLLLVAGADTKIKNHVSLS